MTTIPVEVHRQIDPRRRNQSLVKLNGTMVDGPSQNILISLKMIVVEDNNSKGELKNWNLILNSKIHKEKCRLWNLNFGTPFCFG